jgi:hypothetical protein
MALRLGLFYTAASLSGAFGGLLARGLTSIGIRGRQAEWSWIFIIEGLIVGSLSDMPLTPQELTILDRGRWSRGLLDASK